MIQVRDLGLIPYLQVWPAMKHFCQTRDTDSHDAIWLVEHPPVYSMGLRAKLSDLHQPNQIPIVFSDRGGQITYHGPGQLTAYILLNINRYQLNIRELVDCIERAVIDLLADYGLEAYSQCQAPGVYIEQAKICSLGLRIKRGFSYHGLSLNVDMDLTPFRHINPCGFSNLTMTQLVEHVPNISITTVKQQLVEHLLKRFHDDR